VNGFLNGWKVDFEQCLSGSERVRAVFLEAVHGTTGPRDHEGVRSRAFELERAVPESF
jgi:hypothetical protein